MHPLGSQFSWGKETEAVDHNCWPQTTILLRYFNQTMWIIVFGNSKWHIWKYGWIFSEPWRNINKTLSVIYNLIEIGFSKSNFRFVISFVSYEFVEVVKIQYSFRLWKRKKKKNPAMQQDLKALSYFISHHIHLHKYYNGIYGLQNIALSNFCKNWSLTDGLFVHNNCLPLPWKMVG